MQQNEPTSTDQEMKNGKKASSSNSVNVIRRFFDGNVFTGIAKQGKVIIAILVLTGFASIANGYHCDFQVVKIGKLKKQLLDAKYEATILASELTKQTLQSQIEKNPVIMKSGLETSIQPPYVIKK